MKQLTNKEYEEWQKFKSDRAHGRVLTPDTIRFICAAHNHDATSIGRHFLEILPRLTGKEETAD